MHKSWKSVIYSSHSHHDGNRYHNRGNIHILNVHKHSIKNKHYFTWLAGTDMFEITLQSLKKGEFVPMEEHEFSTQIITVHKGIIQIVSEKGGRGGEDDDDAGLFSLRTDTTTTTTIQIATVGEEIIIPPKTRHKIQSIHGKKAKFSSYYFPPLHSSADDRVRQHMKKHT